MPKKSCSRCDKDTRKGQRLCADCHNAYMRDFRKRSQRKKLERAFLAGYNALRNELEVLFRKIGKGEMNGYTACEVVKNAKPEVPRETLR